MYPWAPDMHPLDPLLSEFCTAHRVTGRAQLAVLLHFTRLAWEKGMPMAPERLCGKNGKIPGLSKKRIQYILQQHGYRPVEARGIKVDNDRLDLALAYCAYLNELYESGHCAFRCLESACLSRFVAYRHAKTLFLKWGLSLETIIADLIEQARKLQRERPKLALRRCSCVILWGRASGCVCQRKKGGVFTLPAMLDKQLRERRIFFGSTWPSMWSRPRQGR